MRHLLTATLAVVLAGCASPGTSLGAIDVEWDGFTVDDGLISAAFRVVNVADHPVAVTTTRGTLGVYHERPPHDAIAVSYQPDPESGIYGSGSQQATGPSLQPGESFAHTIRGQPENLTNATILRSEIEVSWSDDQGFHLTRIVPPCENLQGQRFNNVDGTDTMSTFTGCNHIGVFCVGNCPDEDVRWDPDNKRT